MACLSTVFCTRIRRRTHTRRVVAAPHADATPSSTAMREYSWEAIERATSNFSVVVGYGGFSAVYLAGAQAIKAHAGSDFLHRIFKHELEIMRALRHPNIVSLLGYCDDHDQGALVFHYFRHGSLHDQLRGGSVLPWERRVAIAFQLASALEYLHEHCDPQIVHGDIKASNILLDDSFNCKLCDFGSAKKGFSSDFSSSSTARTSKQLAKMMTNSPGYTDPNYLRTGISSTKNDIYSFGVILLQLLTGMEAICSKRSVPLTTILRPVLAEDGDLQLEDVIDRNLATCDEASFMLSIARRCLDDSPASRPSASQISAAMLKNMGSVSLIVSPACKQ